MRFLKNVEKQRIHENPNKRTPKAKNPILFPCLYQRRPGFVKNYKKYPEESKETVKMRPKT
jgi:hypothetical protein